jgi:hypothetical protein
VNSGQLESRLLWGWEREKDITGRKKEDSWERERGRLKERERRR